MESSWLSGGGRGAVMTRLLLMSRRSEIEKRMVEPSWLVEISCRNDIELKKIMYSKPDQLVNEVELK
jgi:hypothetical protein